MIREIHSKKPDMPKDFFKMHLDVLYFFGLSMEPSEHSIKGFLHKIYGVAIFALCFLLYIISEGVYVLTSGDIGNVTFTLSYFLTQIVGLIKLVTVAIFKEKVTNICKCLESAPFYPNVNRSGEKEIAYVKDAVKMCKVQGYIFHSFVVIIISQRYLSVLLEPGYDKSFYDFKTNTTIIKRIRPTAFFTSLPFDQTVSPYYEITLLYQISTYIIGFVIGSIDAIVCGLMCHVRAQLLILKDCAETYVERAIYLMQTDENSAFVGKITNETQIKHDVEHTRKVSKHLQRYINICVSDLVKHHQLILDLADKIEGTFTLLMLAQFIVSLALICFQLFQLSIYKIPSIRFFSMACYLVLMLFQVSLFCWYGNEVILHSTAVADAIYESNWMVTDLRTQKTFVLMIARAQKPIKFTAAKFSVLSLESLMSIIRGSISYFMVLKGMNAEE